MSIFSLKAKEKNLQLVLNIKPGAKRYICSDIVRIKQILINLIDNAIKFSHNGKIIVFLQSKKRKKHNILHFSVSDSGIGIAAKDTKKLFNLFYQIDCSYSKKYEGTGLGLCISKKLVKLLGGKIWVKSIVNKGSTFHFILPIKKTNLSYNKKIELPKNISIKKSLKILLADDNKVNQRFISYFLKKAGHKVHIANNGEEVLNKINNENYELILMDIQMPIIDGLKTTQIIRNNMKKNLSQISIIALTAYARKEEKEKFKKAGFNSHVTKPVNIEKLINTIEEIDKIKFSKSSNFSSSDSHTDSYTDTEINKNNDTLPYTSANKKIILNKLGNDEKLFDYVFYPFTNEIPNKINLLQKNIQQFNYDEINRIAHSLKGSSGTIGADLCSYLSNKIEIAAKKHDMKNIKNIYSHLEKELKHIQNL